MSSGNTKKSLSVKKTYKLFINGAFPRTESGRYFPIRDTRGNLVANMCRASRKDFRNSAEAASKAQSSWAGRTAYNRSQIIYRMAEMLQQAESVFIPEMIEAGVMRSRAGNEFQDAVDTLVYYAGWCDKYQQVISSVNPVSGTYFNFSVPEPMGVVASIAPENSPLKGLLQSIIPAICGGNTVVTLASNQYSTIAISLAEVISNSDLPVGVINILTGFKDELRHHFASHMDVKALTFSGASGADVLELEDHAAENMKRTLYYTEEEIMSRDLKFISDLQEIKTTWHPIERIGTSGSGY